MAVTKIHPINGTLNKAIAYISNTHKTDDQVFVSSYACTPEVADIQFDRTNKTSHKQGSVLAHHLIQSFLPGEVNPDEAHQIGIELANQHLRGNYQYVIATHVDKEHIHNHIIFNSVSFTNKNHYHSNNKTYYQIRSISDQLCKEHHLSIVIPTDNYGKSYYEYQISKQGNSYKQKLKDNIDQLIPISKDIDDLLSKLEQLGYEIKRGKYISCRAYDQERFTRLKRLGEEYTEESISKRIDAKSHPFPFKKRREIKDFINMNDEKIKNSIGLTKWAKKENLKLSAKTVADFQESKLNKYLDLEKAIQKETHTMESARIQIKDIEVRINQINPLIKYLEDYGKYKKYHNEFLKSKDQTKYSVNHHTELALYNAAVNYLNNCKSETISSRKVLIQERKELKENLAKLYLIYNDSKKNLVEYNKTKKNIDISLSKESDINNKYNKSEI